NQDCGQCVVFMNHRVPGSTWVLTVVGLPELCVALRFALSRQTKVSLHNPLKRETTLAELASCLVLVYQHSAYSRITRLWLGGRFASGHDDCSYFTSARGTVQHQVFSPGINCVG